jgi:hypothetical protein
MRRKLFCKKTLQLAGPQQLSCFKKQPQPRMRLNAFTMHALAIQNLLIIWFALFSFFFALFFHLFIFQEFVPNWGLSNGETWSLLEAFVELFFPTADTIRCLEGEKYITQSLILLQLCALERSNKKVAEKCMGSDNS